MTAHDDPGGSRFLVGPGPRLVTLGALLRALGATVQSVLDLEDLGAAAGTSDTLILDTATFWEGDLGYVSRHLARRPRGRLIAVGDDAGTRIARVLTSMRGARWIAWPPTVDELVALVEPADGATVTLDAPTRAPSAATPRSPASHHTPARPLEPDDEIDEIQAILDGDDPRDARAPDSVIELEERDTPRPPPRPFEAPLDTIEPAQAKPVDARGTWRAQVADLADLAQKIELASQAVGATEPEEEELQNERLDALDIEVRRLVMFAHTLGLLIAPPARGSQVFDLAEMANVFVVDLGNSGPDAPRCQFRSQGSVQVRSDRALLGAAFDAIFYLVRACSRAGDLVRAEVRRRDDIVELRIEFPAGPLQGVEPEKIVEPYAMRARLPELGANALAAAAAILDGQGGRATLGRLEKHGRLEWRVELPAEDGTSTPARASR